MTFKQYILERAKENESFVTTEIEAVATKAEVSAALLKSVYHGQKIQRYPKAKAISEATGGKVTIEELCE